MSEILTRSKVKKAGRVLKKVGPESSQYFEALDVLLLWRSVHTSPLRTALDELRAAAKNVGQPVILASRPKRVRSIIEKLKRETSMSLDKMQDIGGCRVVMRTIKDVNKTARVLRKKKHILTANNYLKRPKPDGYRGIHLVGRYQNGNFSNLFIEFQIRTRIQHAWATAGEITELFTNKSIKNLHGDERWKAFYKDLAEVFDTIDSELTRRDVVFETLDARELVHELKELLTVDKQLKLLVNSLKVQHRELDVMNKFQAYSRSLNFIDDSQLADENFQTGFFLIEVKFLSSRRPEIKLVHYQKQWLEEAQHRAHQLEKKIIGKDDSLVVLVSSEAAGGIRQSYPNYFADSQLFTKLLNAILSA